MTTHLQQGQTWQRAKIGLIVVAPLAQGSGVAMGNPQADRPANRTGADLGPEGTIPGPEPPVLVEYETDARRIAGPDHRLQIGADGGRRLLAEDVDPTPRSQLDERAMRLGPGANLDKIQPLLALEQGKGSRRRKDSASDPTCRRRS